MNEHIDELCSQLDKLQFYHFVSKAQAAYLRGLKDDKCFVFLDFAENYRYVVRGSVQGFHWNNSGTTLHTFAAYYKEQNYLNSISYCVPSDYLRHNANFVHGILLPRLGWCPQFKPS